MSSLACRVIMLVAPSHCAMWLVLFLVIQVILLVISSVQHNTKCLVDVSCFVACFCVKVVGRVLLLQLIDYLTSRYLTDPLVTRLLNSSRVHILPSMNPDGFESSTRDCMNIVGRWVWVPQNGIEPSLWSQEV